MHRENNRFGENISGNRVRMEGSSSNPARGKREETETPMSLTQPDQRTPHLNCFLHMSPAQINQSAHSCSGARRIGPDATNRLPSSVENRNRIENQ